MEPNGWVCGHDMWPSLISSPSARRPLVQPPAAVALSIPCCAALLPLLLQALHDPERLGIEGGCLFLLPLQSAAPLLQGAWRESAVAAVGQVCVCVCVWCGGAGRGGVG